MRLCERRGCRSRNRKALWLINRRAYCLSCFETVLETTALSWDDMHIVRLSDDDRDFPERIKMTHAHTQPAVIA
jgi:hypothetical protein